MISDYTPKMFMETMTLEELLAYQFETCCCHGGRRFVDDQPKQFWGHEPHCPAKWIWWYLEKIKT